ncbi:hypothetical protein NGB36_08095 [Streptomyces sp. RB6PN25]|uniref:Uncharacterized protein n=1 Tax=Streptomyces humicola TaxID=2953240 RepID=A0ABT1PSB6_9ACTN|nr:hypothetical protein [Streptomyces humicola]MCQ4080564.1 hypothetical protein [Streptomyces humicola]
MGRQDDFQYNDDAQSDYELSDEELRQRARDQRRRSQEPQGVPPRSRERSAQGEDVEEPGAFPDDQELPSDDMDDRF